MELADVVMKLVGPVQPVGDSGIDEDRFHNLEALTDLIDRLLFEVRAASYHANRPEASLKKIGVYARDYRRNVHEDTAEPLKREV